MILTLEKCRNICKSYEGEINFSLTSGMEYTSIRLQIPKNIGIRFNLKDSRTFKGYFALKREKIHVFLPHLINLI